VAAEQKLVWILAFKDQFSRNAAKLSKSFMVNKQTMDKMRESAKKASAELKKLGDRAKETGKKFTSMGKKIALGVTAPILGFGALAVKSAASAQEMESKLDAAFGSGAEDVRRWSETFGAAANRGTTDLREMAASAGALLGNSFSGKALSQVSTQIVEMSEDLGSFFDVGTEEAFGKIASGLAGSFEPLRQFGVLTNKAEIDAVALKIAIAAGSRTITEANRTTALLSIIQSRQSAAMGDAIRTKQSFTNQMKGMTGAFRDVKVAIGNELLPVLVPFVKGIAEFFKNVKKTNPEMLRMGLIIAGLVAVVGPLIIGVGFLITAFGVIAGALAAITAAGLIAAGMFVAVAVGVGLIIGLVIVFSDEILAAQDAVFSFISSFGDFLATFLDGVVLFELIGNAVGNLIDQFLDFTDITGRITNLFESDAFGAVKSFFGIGAEAKQTTDVNVNSTINGKISGADITSIQSQTSQKSSGPPVRMNSAGTG